MNPAQLRAHIEAYLNLRSSLGFRTAPEAGNLHELSDYLETQGFSWPVRTQTILDWISAAALHCGLPGQRMRLIRSTIFSGLHRRPAERAPISPKHEAFNLLQRVKKSAGIPVD